MGIFADFVTSLLSANLGERVHPFLCLLGSGPVSLKRIKKQPLVLPDPQSALTFPTKVTKWDQSGKNNR